jgi:hypothetical protein
MPRIRRLTGPRTVRQQENAISTSTPTNKEIPRYFNPDRPKLARFEYCPRLVQSPALALLFHRSSPPEQESVTVSVPPTVCAKASQYTVIWHILTLSLLEISDVGGLAIALAEGS